jgi:hypothetical protein
VTLERLLEGSVGCGLTALDELMWEWTGIAPRRGWWKLRTRVVCQAGADGLDRQNVSPA